MKSSSLLILILLLATVTNSQTISKENWAAVDRKALTVEASSVPELARKLTADYSSTSDKVRSIFVWISTHIEYQEKPALPARRTRWERRVEAEENEDAPLLPVNRRVAERVLQSRSTVCDGYSRLFKSLCDEAGIASEIIIGYGNVSGARSGVSSNHAWNAVLIDTRWQLLDVTWASGYILTPNGTYIASQNERYFLSDPEEFYRDHFPDDMRWSLLPVPPVPSFFRQTPYRNRSFVKYPFTSFSPKRGVISAELGDTVRISLSKAALARNASIAADSIWDRPFLFRSGKIAYLEPESSSTESSILYSYPVLSSEVQWLNVLYNGDVVLRYHLEVRNSSPAWTRNEEN